MQKCLKFPFSPKSVNSNTGHPHLHTTAIPRVTLRGGRVAVSLGPLLQPTFTVVICQCQVSSLAQLCVSSPSDKCVGLYLIHFYMCHTRQWLSNFLARFFQQPHTFHFSLAEGRDAVSWVSTVLLCLQYPPMVHPVTGGSWAATS